MRTRAAVVHGLGRPFELAELELRPPGPRDVAVRMAAIGICVLPAAAALAGNPQRVVVFPGAA